MSEPLWSPELGERLKQSRLDAGIELDALARHCALSVEQLIQLEEGGDNKFYNSKIKLQSGLKAIRAVQSIFNNETQAFRELPPPLTTHNSPPESFSLSTHQSLDRLAKIQPTNPKNVATKKPAVVNLGSWFYFLGAFIVACFSLFLLFEH